MRRGPLQVKDSSEDKGTERLGQQARASPRRTHTITEPKELTLTRRRRRTHHALGAPEEAFSRGPRRPPVTMPRSGQRRGSSLRAASRSSSRIRTSVGPAIAKPPPYVPAPADMLVLR